MSGLVTAGRLVLGAWLLVNGANHFLGFYPEPAGRTPLAIQLMTALVDGGMLDVGMAIQIVAGALLLAGAFVPLALCVAMPLSTCWLYWAAVLNQEPLGALLALVAFALNGLLMLAHLDDYRAMLRRHALAAGETEEDSYEARFVDPRGRTSRARFIAALIPLLAAAALYVTLVPFFISRWNLAVLLVPGFVLVARRLHDMGRSAWLLLLPVVLIASTAWLGAIEAPGQATARLAALLVCAGFLVWGATAKGAAGANRFGPPAAGA